MAGAREDSLRSSALHGGNATSSGDARSSGDSSGSGRRGVVAVSPENARAGCARSGIIIATTNSLGWWDFICSGIIT